MKKIPLFRCLALAAGITGALAAQPLTAQTVPSQTELEHNTPSGNYLAARTANLDRDAAAAAAYYTAALNADPKNTQLMELAFYAELASGHIERAVTLAERLLAVDHNNRNARLILGVHALKFKQYKEARAQFAQAGRDPITSLTVTLLSAWALTILTRLLGGCATPCKRYSAISPRGSWSPAARRWSLTWTKRER